MRTIALSFFVMVVYFTSTIAFAYTRESTMSESGCVQQLKNVVLDTKYQESRLKTVVTLEEAYFVINRLANVRLAESVSLLLFFKEERDNEILRYRSDTVYWNEMLDTYVGSEISVVAKYKEHIRFNTEMLERLEKLKLPQIDSNVPTTNK